MILLGIIGGYLLIIKRSKKYNISSEHIDNLAIITVPLAIVGARLYHVVSEWNYYKDNLNQIISYQMNGLGIFGAIIVGIIVFYLYSKKHSIPILRLLDLGSLGLLIGQIIGRFGNYFNKELYGYPTKLPWKVFIPYENRMEGYLKYEYYHPTFFYESIWNLVGLLIALYYERKKEKINNGTIFSFYLMWYGIGRFLIGFLRIEPVDFLIFNDGQILSIIFVVLGFGLLMNSRKKKHKLVSILKTEYRNTPTKNNIGLYIHIPFCIQKCNYCSFTSFTNISEKIKQKYIDELIDEIVLRTAELKNKTIKWIYFGGGTPNILTISQLEKIVGVLPKDYEELSIELNPGITKNRKESLEYLKYLNDLGFNRMSIGVQSFDDKELKIFGRIHDSKAAKDFLHSINEAGVINFNVDFILGLNSKADLFFHQNITEVIKYNPKHISIYMLSVEPKTKLFDLANVGKFSTVDDKEFEELYCNTTENMESIGYHQYEVSNYSKHNYECKYNLNTWRNGEYLGCGLSAESHIDNKRYENTYNLKDYLNGGWKSIKKIAYINNLSRFETKILLGLRLQEGVNLNPEINSLPEKNRKEFLANLEKQVEQGNIIYFGKDNIKIPKEKYLILDKIIDDLLL